MTNDTNKLLELKNIEKSYNGKQVLKKCSISMEYGEVIGIAGKSGSGKSTVANIAAGLIEPDKGSVLFMGSKIESIHRRKRDIQKFPLQMIFQNARASFNDKMTMGKSLYNAAEKVYDKSEIADAVENALTSCGLESEFKYRYPQELSGGQLQRMAIARAILTKPRLLIADEITSSLDIPIQIEIMRMLKDICEKRNMGLIFISHDLNAIWYMTDKLIVFSDGNMVFDGCRKDLLNKDSEDIKELIKAHEMLQIKNESV